MSRCERYRGAGDGFAGSERGAGGYAEEFVRGTAEGGEVMVARGPHEEPVDKVARAVEDCRDMAVGEETALDNGVYGFKDVGALEFERARQQDGVNGGLRGLGEVEDFSVFV